MDGNMRIVGIVLILIGLPLIGWFGYIELFYLGEVEATVLFTMPPALSDVDRRLQTAHVGAIVCSAIAAFPATFSRPLAHRCPIASEFRFRI